MGDVATRAPFFAVGLGCLFAAFHAFRVAPETLVLQRGTMTKASARSSTRGVEERSEKTADDDVSRGGDAATGLKDVAKRRPTTKHSAFGSTRDEDSSLSEEKEKEKAERVRRARRDFFAASGVNAALFFSGSGGRATLVPLLAASVHGMDVAEIGALFSAMALTSLLGAAPAAALADAAPRRRVVFAAMGLSSVAVFATAAAGIGEIEISSKPSEMTVASQDWSPALTTTRRATMSSGDALTRRDTRRESHTETGGVTT